MTTWSRSATCTRRLCPRHAVSGRRRAATKSALDVSIYDAQLRRAAARDISLSRVMLAASDLARTERRTPLGAPRAPAETA